MTGFGSIFEFLEKDRQMDFFLNESSNGFFLNESPNSWEEGGRRKTLVANFISCKISTGSL